MKLDKWGFPELDLDGFPELDLDGFPELDLDGFPELDLDFPELEGWSFGTDGGRIENCSGHKPEGRIL